MNQQFSRRKFILQSILSAGTAVAAGLLFVGCGSGTASDEKKESKSSEGGENNKAPGNENKSDVVTESDLQKRKQLGYVEKSPLPESHCSNCALYILPKEGKEKGGCQLFKGEVEPGGYCTYWAPPQQ